MRSGPYLPTGLSRKAQSSRRKIGGTDAGQNKSPSRYGRGEYKGSLRSLEKKKRVFTRAYSPVIVQLDQAACLAFALTAFNCFPASPAASSRFSCASAARSSFCFRRSSKLARAKSAQHCCSF